jgi:hypothetical protein
MDRLDVSWFAWRMTSSTASSTTITESIARPTPELVLEALQRRSVAMLSTVSAAGRPHAAAVLYGAVGHQLFISTHRTSRKGRNVAEHPWAAVVVPVRRLPVGPPASIQFQARAEVLELDDPELRRLAEAGRLKAVTSHGELDLAGGCFLRLTPVGRLHTYGLGLSLRQFLRNPLAAGGSVELTRP